MGALNDFKAIVDKVYGMYLDSQQGFHHLTEYIKRAQADTSTATGLPLAELDSKKFTYGQGAPDDPTARVQHEITQGELKARNAKHGSNALFLGSMCVVSIFQFWEDEYRNLIAIEHGLKRDDLKHDLMGDLRLIRNAIIHHRGIAKKEIEKCRVLTWFSDGDEIKIDEERIFVIARLISEITF